MHTVHNNDSINNCDSDSDSNYDDEDESTLIIPPESTTNFLLTKYNRKIITFYFPVEDTKECLKSRHILGILGFLGFANVYAMRVNLSVAIVAMVNSTANPQPVSNNTFDFCPVPNITNSTTPDVTRIRKNNAKSLIR